MASEQIGVVDYGKLLNNIELVTRVTTRNEFIASGIEVAFNSYELADNLKTRVDGILITNTLIGGSGSITFGDGVIENYG
jgi:hypothetical protein